MSSKIVTVILFFLAAGFILCCQNGPVFSPRKGEPHIELTWAVADGPTTLRLFFSENVSETSGETNRYRAANSSTGDEVKVVSASASQQIVTLTLEGPTVQSPWVLVAGHVYDVKYNVEALEYQAVAQGTHRLLADFWPDKVPDLSVWKDSAGRLMLKWTPDNRIGNTGIEVWKKTTMSRAGDSTLLAKLPSTSSLYWPDFMAIGIELFALKVVNPYGESEPGEWVAPRSAGVETFLCMGECISNHVDSLVDSLQALDFQKISRISDCNLIELENESNGMRLIFKYHPQGVEQVSIDSLGQAKSDTIFQPCQ
jgi:hypothetical protein